MIHCLPLQCLKQATGVHRFLPSFFGWLSSCPVKLKNEAHQGDGMPTVIICDNAKEIFLGELNRKLKEALCHLRQTEEFTPWSNAERQVKGLKKGSGRKLIKSGTLKRLWKDCLELESYLRSNTAHGIYKLNGEVPKTIMSR